MKLSAELANRLKQSKEKLGDQLAILGHHYQSDEIVSFCDLTGDSLELARKIEHISAPHIVFCGVYFMAESAALLAQLGQKVYMPDTSADCVMANMAPAALLDAVLQKLSQTGRKIIPLAYVNTSLALKAVVGAHGGTVCTSSNARTMLRWAREQGDAVLFVPDKNLAQNTANAMGIPEHERHILDIRQHGAHIDMDAAQKASLLIWPGCCAVHARFNSAQIETVRRLYPTARVFVHPECSPELVDAADGAGSTSYLIKTIAESPADSMIFVGTEYSLVNRLSQRHSTMQVLPLLPASCSNMVKTTAQNLAELLTAIENGSAVPVSIPEVLAPPARAALERMLETCR